MPEQWYQFCVWLRNFSILGFLAQEQGVDIADVAESGMVVSVAVVVGTATT